MNWKFVSALAVGAALLASVPAQAASCKKDADCSSGQVCSAGTCVKKASRAASDAASAVSPTDSSTAGTKRTPYIGWGGLGLYNVGQTVTIGGFSASGSTTYFGFHAGAAANLLQLTPDLPLVGWGDVALTLGGDLFFPLSAGAGVRYDKAGPVQLLGGVGFAILPNTISGAPTPVGVRLMGMVLYPLPQVHPNLSAQLQLSYDILNNGFHLFTFTVGAGWAL
jgi:hypothetical protein